MTRLSRDDIKGNIKLVEDIAKSLYPDEPLIAQLTVTQSILEGALYKSPPSSLALVYNNLFGITEKQGTGLVLNGVLRTTISLPSIEYEKGHRVHMNRVFSVNASVEDSIRQHQRVLGLDRYKKLKEAKTFEEIAGAVQDCGYATDPNYSKLLIMTYKKYLL